MLQARLLSAVSSVNAFRYATTVQQQGGTAFDVYFQLYDDSQVLDYQTTLPYLNRYIPASGSTATVEFINIDDSKEFTRTATQPFSLDDRSIFKVAVLSTDVLDGTISFKIRLTESGATKIIFLQYAIGIHNDPGAC